MEHVKPGQKVNIGLGHDLEVVEIMRGGRNRMVWKVLTEPKGQEKIVKIFGESVEIETTRQANELLSDTLEYRRCLERFKVPVPRLSEMDIRIHYNPLSKKLNLTEINPCFGNDLEGAIQKADEATALRLVQRILDAVSHLFVAHRGTLLSVGLDILPRNFTLGSRLRYIDLLPPKIKKNGRYLLELPEVKDTVTRRLGIFRHYDKRGLMTALLVHVGKLRPSLLYQTHQSINTHLEAINHQQLIPYLESIFHCLENTETADLHKKIKRLQFKDIYTLRLLACILAANKRMTTTELHRFFLHSHFQHQPLTKKRVHHLRRTLINKL